MKRGIKIFERGDKYRDNFDKIFVKKDEPRPSPKKD